MTGIFKDYAAESFIELMPLISIFAALVAFAYNHNKEYKLNKIAYFMQLRQRMYSDDKIAFVINSAIMGRITWEMFDDVEFFTKMSAALGFLDEICHLYNTKYLGKDEFAYFDGEIYAVLNNPEIKKYLDAQEQKNASRCEFSGDALTDVDRVLPYTTLQITNYAFSANCPLKDAYQHFAAALREKYRRP